MGNQQSAEAPPRPHTKLTKPRTNTSSSNLLARASWRSSNIDVRTVGGKRLGPALTVENEADVEIDHKSRAGGKTRRRSLFRSRSARPLSKAIEVSDVENNISSPRFDRPREPGSIHRDKTGMAYRNGTDT